jgi:ribosomal protein L7/L12
VTIIVRVTIWLDWNSKILAHTINLMRIVRQWGGYSLSEAKHLVEGCVAGTPIVIEVPTESDAETLAGQTAEAGFASTISQESGSNDALR